MTVEINLYSVAVVGLIILDIIKNVLICGGMIKYVFATSKRKTVVISTILFIVFLALYVIIAIHFATTIASITSYFNALSDLIYG